MDTVKPQHHYSHTTAIQLDLFAAFLSFDYLHLLNCNSILKEALTAVELLFNCIELTDALTDALSTL